MSFGAARASTCRTTVLGRLTASATPSGGCFVVRNGLQCVSGSRNGVLSAKTPVWTRGKRTTTKMRSKDLPQGSLFPLTAEVSPATPDKTYSRTLQQHLDNMQKYPDCVLLTRVGDFYELYFDQVEQYAPLVNLKQAKKGDVPMAGFQFTSLPRYLKMFVNDLGKQVAISEQVPLTAEESSSGMKFDRRVARIVSAGTLIDEEFLDPIESNYLLAVHIDGTLPPPGSLTDAQRSFASIAVGLSWTDLSSGELYTQACDLASLSSIIAGIKPSEIVLHDALQHHDQVHLAAFLGEGGYAVHFHTPAQPATTSGQTNGWQSILERPLSDLEMTNFTLLETAALNMVSGFVRSKLLDNQVKLQPPVRKTEDDFMTIDRQSIRGLEIRSTLRDDRFEGSLLHAVRRTVTKSGTRLLTRRLVAPSMALQVINERLDLVQQVLECDALREDVIALLRSTADIRRLLQRFSIDKGNADDLLGLSSTVAIMNNLASRLHEYIIVSQDAAEEAGRESTTGCLWGLLERLDLQQPTEVAKAITDAIDQEGLEKVRMIADEEAVEDRETQGKKSSRSAEASPTSEVDTDSEIWIMRRSASPTLRTAHGDLDKLLGRKRALLQSLRKQLKAESLTFKWTAQLGHHCHLKSSKNGTVNIASLSGARPIGSTKSTRTFHLSDWTELGVIIDDAKLRIRRAEEAVFERLRIKVMENLMRLRRNASVLDELDVACSSATVAKERNLVRPILNSGTAHCIIGGRHPTVDLGLTASGRRFTSNDCMVGSQGASIYLITGPNMGGKSTYLRQNALITILAQTGLYVPATYTNIGLVDKIFSRIGSADSLYQDQSTFMVEMLETAAILKGATKRSFVVMDEVGRGTAPDDGIAVAFAILRHLHDVNRCRALFATHFHDLADMTAAFTELECWCTDVDEPAKCTSGDRNGKDGAIEWSYMHKLRRGVNRESHALKVARLAGMPDEAVAVAGQVLMKLQQRREDHGRDDAVEPQAITSHG